MVACVGLDATGGAGVTAVPVVGIGASAGGLEALTEFFDAMPADSGMAFVVIQHLDPTRQSHMVEVLARHTPMPVTGATDGAAVKPNHVYMILPDGTLTIRAGVLHLAKPVLPRNQRHPVDDFFVSLSDDMQEKAICMCFRGQAQTGPPACGLLRAMAG